MPRGWPPLTRREVIAILEALGLSYNHTRGGHDYYKGVREGQACSVTVSTHVRDFGPDLIQFMCNQANSDRKEFYGATPKTAKKIS